MSATRPRPVPLDRFKLPEREVFDTTGSIYPTDSPDEARRLRHLFALNRSTASIPKNKDSLPSIEAMPGVTVHARRT